MPRTKRRERNFFLEKDPRFSKEMSNNLIQIKPYLKRKQQVNIVPRNLSQESYLELLKNPKKYIIFAIGPAGTGKTMLAVQMAIKLFKEGVISKIVVTRPAVSVDEEHGFLPGTLNQKMEPWTRPIFDVFEEYYHPREVASMLEDGVIEISPLAYMRGRTFKNSFVVADEMQNATHSQMKMLLTRLGENSRMVVTGDLCQADRPRENGLFEFCKLYDEGGDYRMIAMAKFETKDVERHPVVKEILKIYKDVE
ncbi:MAG: PhoH family protein [Proteobacteria bacterium]|nr:PhoH family protein [Pseudomonadota bacterium]NBP14633.1 PhoH family protein [bacterium]